MFTGHHPGLSLSGKVTLRSISFLFSNTRLGFLERLQYFFSADRPRSWDGNPGLWLSITEQGWMKFAHRWPPEVIVDRKNVLGALECWNVKMLH
ncbi:MAG: hypothetical protein KAW12_24165 [Candidatus Aminicenantes bacterium]|nr:hypothetical protein [Candidatus Aminicenantes bacterium]